MHFNTGNCEQINSSIKSPCRSMHFLDCSIKIFIPGEKQLLRAPGLRHFLNLIIRSEPAITQSLYKWTEDVMISSQPY